MIYIPLWLKLPLLYQWKQKALHEGKIALFVLFIKVQMPKRERSIFRNKKKKQKQKKQKQKKKTFPSYSNQKSKKENLLHCL